MRCLVTGCNGFAAKHLINQLKSEGHEVLGIDLKSGTDIRDYDQVRTAIEQARPQRIFHLAAQTYVPESFTDAYRALDVNTTGTLNVLNAVRNTGINARIMVAGTADEYGDADPVEEGVLKPRSPYAVTKVAADHLCQVYSQAYGMDIVVTRAFNHTGPGKQEFNAESSWARQITEVEDGKLNILRHGNLEAVRNFSDVRDIAKAYVKAIELPSSVYNICSDRNVTMQEVLDILMSSARCEIKTEVDPKFLRKYDYDYKTPNCEKFQKLTGWKPEIPLEQTLSDLLDYWRTV